MHKLTHTKNAKKEKPPTPKENTLKMLFYPSTADT